MVCGPLVGAAIFGDRSRADSSSLNEFRRGLVAGASGKRKVVNDVLVIGGGVVGLAVARQCAVMGASVLLVEKEDALAAGASSGNSGLGVSGYDAPAGSLEQKCLRRSIQIHPNLYRSFGLSYEHARKCGSLVVAWTPEQLAELPGMLEDGRQSGDTEAAMLTQEELREIEPALSHAALGAVLFPREAIVEPWLVPMGYAESARLHGKNP
jgi:glycerol-3-phosphate dehydrogenase